MGRYVWDIQTPELEPRKIIECIDGFMENSGCVPAYTLRQDQKERSLQDPYVYVPAKGFEEISWESRVTRLEALKKGEQLMFSLNWREQNPILSFFANEYLDESTGPDELRKWLDDWPTMSPMRALYDWIGFELKAPPADQITISSNLAFSKATNEFKYVTEYLAFVLREELHATRIRVFYSTCATEAYSFTRPT